MGLAILISLFLHLRGGVLARRLRQCVRPRTSAGRQTGRAHHRRFVRDAASARPEKSAVHGDGAVEGVGREAKGADLRVERQLDCGEQASGDWRCASALAGWQRTSRRKSGDARLFAPDRRIEAAARTAINCRAGSEAEPATTPAKPEPSPAPVSTPKPAPVSTPEPEQFAMLKSSPPPPIKAPDETEPRHRKFRHPRHRGPAAEAGAGRFQLSGAKRGNSHYRAASPIAALPR